MCLCHGPHGTDMKCLIAFHLVRSKQLCKKACLFVVPLEFADITDMKLIYDSNILDVTSYDELKTAISAGKWARGPWSGRSLSFSSMSLSPTYVSLPVEAIV